MTGKQIAKLNVKLINRILAHIQADVRRLHMPHWGIKKGSRFARLEGLKAKNFAECNTAACFAGWSKLLSTRQKRWPSLFRRNGTLDIDPDTEIKRLGITQGESFLFQCVHGTPAEQLEVVKDRLRHIVKNRIAAGDNDAKKIKV